MSDAAAAGKSLKVSETCAAFVAVTAVYHNAAALVSVLSCLSLH